MFTWFQAAYFQYIRNGVNPTGSNGIRQIGISASGQGNTNAQCNLGLCFENGDGDIQDRSEALKWFRKAADQEDAQGQMLVGCVYEFGNGVTKNALEAVKWYRLSADQGNAVAQSNLGGCYESGNGRPLWMTASGEVVI